MLMMQSLADGYVAEAMEVTSLGHVDMVNYGIIILPAIQFPMLVILLIILVG